MAVAADSAPVIIRIAQVAGMFVLTNLGWLLFRETELTAIVRDLTLSPFAATALDNESALYLLLLTFVYSLPLWIHSLWSVISTSDDQTHRDELAHRSDSWHRTLAQGIACGLAFAEILVFRSRRSL
ncbi:MAG: hypothetical protein ABIS06_11890, partial [Vicinamibacterales bacterium]